MAEPYRKNPDTEPSSLPDILGTLDSDEINLGPPDEPVRVPLVIYIGGIKRIIGDALVRGNMVEAYIDPVKGRTLERSIIDGTLTTVSIEFNPAPAVPVLNEDGHVTWRKDY